jgi:[acyl-carrier-protein] S-malonyltransferase
MSLAFLFPGQGAEHPGMGAHHGQTANFLEAASDAAGMDVATIAKRGSKRFASTEFIQPALTAVTMGALCALEEAGVQADYVAGLSLGELAASSALGCLDPYRAIEAAAERGRLMGRAAANQQGAMIALHTQDKALVESALAHGNQFGSVCLGARNAVDEWILSGERNALREVTSRFEGVQLRVAGAWHSPAMAPAVEPMRQLLKHHWKPGRQTHFVSSQSGRVVTEQSSIPNLLAEQIARTSHYYQVLQTLCNKGVKTFVTVGPGRIQRSLLRRCVGANATILGSETAKELERTVEALNV